jgi:hypothetical protein
MWTIYLFPIWDQSVTFWCRRIRVWWSWAVRLHNNGAEIPGAGGSAQNWQEIVIWPNWGNFWVRCSNLVITLATSIHFAHMTPIRKALFGAHVMATQLCSVRLVSSPKIRCFPCQSPNFRYFFFPFMVTFRLLFRRWFWARFGPDFRQNTYFITYFILLGFSGFRYFWQKFS